MIDYGLTTFAEHPEPVRSDCHAWSASPNCQLLSIVAGINPSSPGFETVKLEPYLGALKELHSVIPHPRGEINVHYKIEANVLHARIQLPENTKGSFKWNQIVYPLKPGDNKFDLVN